MSLKISGMPTRPATMPVAIMAYITIFLGGTPPARAANGFMPLDRRSKPIRVRFNTT